MGLPDFSGFQDITHVVGDSGKTLQAAFRIQDTQQRGGVVLFMGDEVEDRTRINVACAGSIMTPSNGVKPMEVSIDFPYSTAQTEQPLPRWQVMRR